MQLSALLEVSLPGRVEDDGIERTDEFQPVGDRLGRGDDRRQSRLSQQLGEFFLLCRRQQEDLVEDQLQLIRAVLNRGAQKTKMQRAGFRRYSLDILFFFKQKTAYDIEHLPLGNFDGILWVAFIG